MIGEAIVFMDGDLTVERRIGVICGGRIFQCLSEWVVLLILSLYYFDTICIILS